MVQPIIDYSRTIGFEGVQRINWCFFLFSRVTKKSKRQQHDEHPNHGTNIRRRQPPTANTADPSHTIHRRCYWRDDRGVGALILVPWPAQHHHKHNTLWWFSTLCALVVLVLDTGSQYQRADASTLFCWSLGGILCRGVGHWLDIEDVRADPVRVQIWHMN